MADRLVVSGARGASATDVARRIGTFLGAEIDAAMTDAEVMDAPLSVITEMVEAAGVTAQLADVVTASSMDDGNVTLSGEQSIGGVDAEDGDRVLLTYQDAAAENGAWIVRDDDWERPTDFDGAGEAVSGTLVQVMGGHNAGLWRLTTQGTNIIGTTGLTWRPFSLRSAEKVSFQAVPGAGVFSIGQSARNRRLNLFDVATTRAQVQEIQNDASTDDTDLINEALENAAVVEVPNGFVRTDALSIPTDKALIGFGKKAVLKLAEGALRPIVQNGQLNIEIANLTIDGNGEALDLALFTQCIDAKIHDLWCTNSLGYGITLDACGGCDIDQIRVFDSATLSSYAAINLKNPTADGSFNRVSRVFFRDIIGRGIACIGHNQVQISEIRGLMTNGDFILFEDCSHCTATNLTWAGPGTGGEGGDGIGINGDCSDIVVASFNCLSTAGHAISINGQWLDEENSVAKAGATRCTIGPGVIVSPNEGGVIITDQGVTDSVPSKNIIQGVQVYGAGAKVATESFGVTGGTDNQFIGCHSEGVSGTGGAGTVYGFREIAGGSGNVPARNSFRGILDGTHNTGRSTLASSTSVVIRADQEHMVARVTFNGTTGTIISSAGNIASVTRNGTGDYTINTIFDLPPNTIPGGLAQDTGGVPNQITLTSFPSATSVRIKVVAAGTATATDSALVCVDLR